MKTKDSLAFGALFTKALQESPVHEIEKGGPGSGHYGHAGRPGAVGGSAEGGVAVGRAEADDSDEHFKWSGKANLSRKHGAASVSVSAKAKAHSFEVHGIADKNGKLQRGLAVLRVGGKKVHIDHDELHALRSKMHYLHMANQRGVSHIAGKQIVRGQGIEVKARGNSVVIPINHETIKHIDKAAVHARKHGLSFTAESRRQIRDAVHAMSGTHPLEVVKGRKFSKAGHLAAFIAHVDRHEDTDLKRIVKAAKAGKSLKVKKLINNQHKLFEAVRAKAWEAREKFGGTQAMKHYRKAAVILHNISRA
jgi:hypothetical protein